MKEISLTQGQVALVDDEDYERLSQWKWHCAKMERVYCHYARRTISTERGRGFGIWMHREIIEIPKGMQCDHIDGDGLNNQKSNLRVVTPRQNSQNRHYEKSSKYPGVFWNKSSKKWQTHIRIGKTTKHLGYFKIEEEAATAYRVAEAVLVNDKGTMS